MSAPVVVGVDIGGTKVLAGAVDSEGRGSSTALRTTPELPENMVTVTKGTLPPAKVQTVRPPLLAVPPRQNPEPPMDEPKP